MIKSVPTRTSKPKAHADKVYTLQEAIDLAWGIHTGHIHEGPVNPDTGYPRVYYVCDDFGVECP